MSFRSGVYMLYHHDESFDSPYLYCNNLMTSLPTIFHYIPQWVSTVTAGLHVGLQIYIWCCVGFWLPARLRLPSLILLRDYFILTPPRVVFLENCSGFWFAFISTLNDKASLTFVAHLYSLASHNTTLWTYLLDSCILTNENTGV